MHCSAKNFTEKKNLPIDAIYRDFLSEEKIEIFFGKKLIFFNIFAQNIHRGYTLEPPRRAVLMSTHNICFG